MKKFLASVGHAQLLGKRNGEIVHIADVQTLTESSLGFSVSMEDVRAGEGAKLYGRFAHTTGMTVTLTDAMFDLNYIALQVGAEMEGNATAFENDTLPVNAGAIALKKEPQQIGNACGLDAKVCWIRKVGCSADSDWTAIVVNGKNVTLPAEFASESKVCVRYFVNRPEARQIDVKANFFPAEMMLILTTKLFAGDANSVETGKAVGAITVKIPRFQLDGQFDLNMAMTSAATLSLSGTALAVSDGTCEDGGVYAEIVEVTNDVDYNYNLKSIECLDDTKKVGETPIIYGEYKDGHVSILDNSELTFTPALNNGKFASATSDQKIATSAETPIEITVTIEA